MGRLCHVTNHCGWVVGLCSVISLLEHFQPGISPFCLFLFNLVSGDRYEDQRTPSIHTARRCGESNWTELQQSRACPRSRFLLQSLVLFITKRGQEPPTFTGRGHLADIVNDQTTINWLNLVLNSSLCHGSKVCELLNESVYTQRANQITTFKNRSPAAH